MDELASIHPSPFSLVFHVVDLFPIVKLGLAVVNGARDGCPTCTHEFVHRDDHDEP